ncbi:MAG: hypothetical protein JW729_06880 [Bacteroidales bacterium]|nr:hypothetical protein [Bacteroidales bacterium]
MIPNDENSNPSPEAEVPKKRKRFGLKFGIMITVLVFFLWLLPYLFAQLLFQTTIKTAFAELTQQKYTLNFDNLKINIFTRKATFYNASVQNNRSLDTLSNSTFRLHTDTLLFHNINLFQLQKKSVLKLDNLIAKAIEIDVDLADLPEKRDSKSLFLPLSNFLNSIAIGNFSVDRAHIRYANSKDTLLIPDLKFAIRNLHADSLKDSVYTNRFHYSDADIILQNQEFILPNKRQNIAWNRLELSTQNKYIKLNQFSFQTPKTDTSKTALNFKIPHLYLNGFELDSLLLHKKLIAGEVDLLLDTFQLDLKTDSSLIAKQSFQEQLGNLLKPLLEEIKIDSAKIVSKNSLFSLPNNKQISLNGVSNGKFLRIYFDANRSDLLQIEKGSVDINHLFFTNLTSKMNFSVENSNFDLTNNTIAFNHLNFESDSMVSLQIELEQLAFRELDFRSLFANNSLRASEILLSNGNYTQLKAGKTKPIDQNIKQLEQQISQLFSEVKIEQVRFENWNYILKSKGIRAENATILLNNFKSPTDATRSFGLFSDFEGEINRISWPSEDQRQHYLANKLEINSKNQNIQIQKIQSFPRWKTLKNEMISENARYKIFGQKLNISFEKPFDQLDKQDTFQISQLFVDSLSVQQFGKNKLEYKNKKKKVLLYTINEFELRTGNFATYKDSSVINRLSQINGIHLSGDTLIYRKDSLSSINYKHLYAITKNGFYQNTAKGLSFKFKKIDFDSDDELIGLYDLQGSLKENDPNGKIEHALTSKLVQLKGFDHNLYLRLQLIAAKEFNIQSPSLVSKSVLLEPKNSGSLKDLISNENLSSLPYLQFDRFIIRDFTWLATYTTKGDTFISSFEKANLSALDFRLSNRSFTDPNRVLFSETLNFDAHNLKQYFDNGNYLLRVNDIGFSSDERRLTFDKLQFYTLQKENQNNYHFAIDQIALQSIDLIRFQQSQDLWIESILILNPETRLKIYTSDETSPLFNINTLALYPSIHPYFNSIQLRKIDVRDMTLNLEMPKDASTNVYNLGRLDLQMEAISIDSLTQPFYDNRFFYAENTRVRLRNYSARIASDLYRVEFDDLRLSTQQKLIEIDSIRLIPQYGYDRFAEKVGYQTDRFDVTAKSVRMQGVNFQDALFRQKYTVQHIAISNAVGEAYRNGLIPRREDFYPLNPLQKLLALPHFIQVDSLYFLDSKFTYKELGEHANYAGQIFFDHLNIQIYNATNNPDFIAFGGHSLFNAQTLLMGKSQLNLAVNFPLSEGGKSFDLQAHLDKTQIEDLEPILRPLALIQAQSGTIKTLDLTLKANDDYATGEMLMLYDNLKVEVLNKSLKKGIINSFFANALIRRENPSYLIPRRGPIYFERRKNRSLFNYWAETTILGMKTSMGLADRRTAKKLKRLNKQ